MKRRLQLALISVTFSGCSSLQGESDSTTRRRAAESTSEVVLMSDVEWKPLNPARGDKGPKAGDLWGDRTGPGPSGFLVEFVDGFESPPHIHNVSYRGAVISGLVHNDDPDAAEMWMPTGSFWTQPSGGVHITAAKGNRNLAYIEIEEGPYLVLPVEEEFQSDEMPINVAASNIVWVDPPGRPGPVQGPKVAYLWGKVQEGELIGTLVKLPAGSSVTLRSRGAALRAVMIQGRPGYLLPNGANEIIEPGSSFSSKGESVHRISCSPEEECVIYVRADGQFEVIPAQL